MSDILFSNNGYKVERFNILLLGGPYTQWLVSDGEVSFTLGYEPTLTLDGLKEEVRLYKLEKKDEVTKHEK